MKILVINCGSSSLKFQLINMENEQVLAKGRCDKIGDSSAFIEYKGIKMTEKMKIDKVMADHSIALQEVIDLLVDKEIGAIKDISEITATGHRIVSGGERLKESVIVTDDVIEEIKRCIDLAPLHNPGHLMGIMGCKKVLPNIPMVTVFDTAYHQTMPEYAYLYGLPYEYYEKFKVRKYGAHGTSHRYVCERAAEMLGIPQEKLNIISCHLGNGASVCAIKNGKSVDTSMGLTPLEGLMMGTRTGDMDPAIAKFLIDHTGMTIEEYNEMINKKSGLLGVSGLSNDVRELRILRDQGNKKAELALEMQTYRIKKYIASYFPVLGRVDAITIEGGIGEHNPDVVWQILEGFENFGIVLDDTKADFEFNPRELVLTKPESSIQVLLIPTDEEFMIAKDTMKLINEIR